MKKIKVIHIIPTLLVGGAERIVMDIVKNIDKSKFDISIIMLFSKDYCAAMYKDIIKQSDIDILYLNKKKGFDISIIIKLLKIIKREKPNVVHTHLYACGYSIIPVLLGKVKVRIHTVHNMAEKELPYYYQKAMYVAYNYLNFIPVAISTNVKSSILNRYKLEINRVPQINNGVDTNKYSKKSSSSNENSDFIKLINVGRFHEQKNHKMLIDVFYKVWKRNSNVRLILIGDGELKPEIKKRVEDLGIEEYVDFTGIVSNVEDYLSSSDVFVMTSNFEGLPLVMIEAMAAGLPIISTDVGGIHELVDNGYNGYVVNLGKEQELSDYILKLVNNINLREKLGENSIERAKKYDLKLMTKLYEKLYEENN